MDAQQREKYLHAKYYGLRRTRDDSLVEGWYFVIRERDIHGHEALLAYADSCERSSPGLASDLRDHVWREQEQQDEHPHDFLEPLESDR